MAFCPAVVVVGNSERMSQAQAPSFFARSGMAWPARNFSGTKSSSLVVAPPPLSKHPIFLDHCLPTTDCAACIPETSQSCLSASFTAIRFVLPCSHRLLGDGD